MTYIERKKVYKRIEKERKTKVLSFVTSDRAGFETKIAPDCIDLFVSILDSIGPCDKISLFLHTNGGHTLSAWRLVNLIRTFCDQFEVLIPLKALSAGTLIAIGSDNVVMSKQAALGPIDPSITHPLSPQTISGGQPKLVPVSVEAVRGYLDAARDELGIKGEAGLSQVLINLAGYIHPLVLGEIFRSRAQIRFLADKLIHRQVSDPDKKKSIIDFLCADSGSHDYTINRREAAELGLNVEKPSQALYELMRAIHLDFSTELKLLDPFSPQHVVGNAPPGTNVPYMEVRGLVEGAGICYGFVSEGTLTRVQFPSPHGSGMQEAFQDDRSFEGWRKLP